MVKCAPAPSIFLLRSLSLFGACTLPDTAPSGHCMGSLPGEGCINAVIGLSMVIGDAVTCVLLLGLFFFLMCEEESGCPERMYFIAGAEKGSKRF